MQVLSIFVDESGDFGEYAKHAPYCIVLNCEIKYKSFIFHKIEFKNNFKLEDRIARDISLFIKENLLFFLKYDKIILYYDNGQHELSQILNAVFEAELPSFEVRKVLPSEYRLFQVADLLCTLELLKEKIKHGNLSKSEEIIFHSKRDFKKDFLKGIQKKEWR